MESEGKVKIMMLLMCFCLRFCLMLSDEWKEFEWMKNEYMGEEKMRMPFDKVVDGGWEVKSGRTTVDVDDDVMLSHAISSSHVGIC